jgi:hypothetical protein
MARIKTPAKNLEELIADLGLNSVDLLKCDIEGAEIDVLDACSDEFFKKIAQITVEFHDARGLTPRSEVKRIIRRLRGLRFFPVRMSGKSYLDTFFINRAAALYHTSSACIFDIF